MKLLLITLFLGLFLVQFGNAQVGGNVGIGTSSPGFPLNFSNTLGDKIALWGNTGPHYGFGIKSNLLQIHTDVVGSDVVFGYGTSAAFTETMRIKGNGNVGIGLSSPGFPLNFPSVVGDKISLWGNSGNNFGFGVQAGVLQIHTSAVNEDVVFGFGSSVSFNETMRVKGNGNVGIANNNPAFKLDVHGRVRLRHSADGTPGIWFNKSDNTVPIAFMGLLNDEYVGLYGAQGSAWNFVMSTITGNVGIGLPSPTQKLHVNGGGLFNGVLTASTGASGATANGNAVGIFEDNSSAYINILTPNATESGVLFGNPTSAVHGGILYNSTSTPNGLQFRTNGNVIRMSLSNTGNLGIGTTNPISKLHIRNGNSGADLYDSDMATFENNGDAYINLYTPSNKISGIRFTHPFDSAAIHFNKGSVSDGFRFQIGSNTVALVIDELGRVGIGTSSPDEQLHCVGDGEFGGTVTASCGLLACSDFRYKKNILPLTNTISSIQLLNGVYYHWDKEKFPEKQFTDHRQIGIIAQELEKVFPEVVQTDASGYKTVDYSRLSPVLLEAIKEQQQIIDTQNTRLDHQQKQIDMLTTELRELKEIFSEIGSRREQE